MGWLLKHRWFWLATFVLLAGSVIGILTLGHGEGRITRANFDKIRDGATMAEIEEILGPPLASHQLGQVTEVLWNDGGLSYIIATINPDGRCAGKSFETMTESERIHRLTADWLRKAGIESPPKRELGKSGF